MSDLQMKLAELADHLSANRESILQAWRRAIQKDPSITSGDSLPRSGLFDHIPALLRTFEHGLRGTPAEARRADADAQDQAAAHGLQRWQQGYDLREVSREWGKLNQCVLGELDRYALTNPAAALEAMIRAREVWANLCSTGLEASVHQYFSLQQREAAGHVKDLESALEQVRALEQERGAVWQQATQDLRGSVSGVANVAMGLARHGRSDASREDFLRMLMRNVTSLHQLLGDLTSLTRLQAGEEARQVERIDVTAILEPLCERIRPLATKCRLHLISTASAELEVEGDGPKLRRIAESLILNAVRYTPEGTITVSWGDGGSEDPKRWTLSIADTGPGFHTQSGQPLAAALDPKGEPADAAPADSAKVTPLFADSPVSDERLSLIRSEPGEGISLSIVKRLCELLDATIEMQSVDEVGTVVRVYFPKHYAV